MLRRTRRQEDGSILVPATVEIGERGTDEYAIGEGYRVVKKGDPDYEEYDERLREQEQPRMLRSWSSDSLIAHSVARARSSEVLQSVSGDVASSDPAPADEVNDSEDTED